MGGLIISTPLFHTGYTITVLIIYMLCFIFDFSSLLWRIILISLNESNSRFVIVSMIMNLLLLVIDSFMVFFISNLLPRGIVYMENIEIALRNSQENEKYLQIVNKTSDDLFISRIRFFTVTIAEIVFFAIAAAITFIGLTFSQKFANLIFAQSPHAFLWLGGFGISKGLNDRGGLLLFIIAYVIAFFLDILSLVWRIILIVNCYAFGSWSTCIWVTPYSGYMCSCFRFICLLFDKCVLLLDNTRGNRKRI